MCRCKNEKGYGRFGHVVRMADERLLKQIYNANVDEARQICKGRYI